MQKYGNARSSVQQRTKAVTNQHEVDGLSDISTKILISHVSRSLMNHQQAIEE